MSLELLARSQACGRTLEAYLNQPFKLGRYDCARMVARHGKHMGHKISVSRFGTYTTLAGAVRALKRQGFDSLEAVFDEMWERIPPAMAIMGDVLAVPSDDGGLCAMTVRMDGQNHLNAFGGGFAVSEMTGFTVAWRVTCLIPADTSEVL